MWQKQIVPPQPAAAPQKQDEQPSANTGANEEQNKTTETPVAAPRKQNDQTNTNTNGEQNKITEAKVIMENFSFGPDTLKIKAGATVTWTNNDSAPHDVKSDLFASPKLAKGEFFSFKFEEVGTYDYICGIHPKMKGKIIVE